MEVFVDDETKLTLHGLQQYYCKLKDSEKNRKLFDLLDVLEFNQVCGKALSAAFGMCSFMHLQRRTSAQYHKLNDFHCRQLPEKLF